MSAPGADFTFVHFTDTHVMAGLDPAGAEVDTTATLRRVVEVLNALEPRPAFGIVGGDLVSPDLLVRDRTLSAEEYAPSYALLASLLDELAFPTHLLLGNHDHREAFHRVMAPRWRDPALGPDDPQRFALAHEGYRLLALDSLLTGRPWGEVGRDQLDWLDRELAAVPDAPALVFVHHHPWPIDVAWMDAMALRGGGQALIDTLGRHPQARWLVCGHVHQDHAVQRDGLTMLTTPSTCFQVSKVSQTRRILPGPPGFRLFRVRGTEVSTRVLHLAADGGIERL